MAIPTSRTHEKARPTIDTDLCNGCGLCVQVCKDFTLRLVDGKVAIGDHPVFGCIGCGHCIAVCPQGTIKIRWNESAGRLQEKMVEHFEGAVKGKEGKSDSL